MARLWLGSRYRLDEKLGSGGNATVWRAWDRRMQRFVAVKVLKESFGGSNSMDRFGREALILGRLSSPNIIVVHDRGLKQVVRHPGEPDRTPRGSRLPWARSTPRPRSPGGRAMSRRGCSTTTPRRCTTRR
ncbi:protein kinase domain-containing protein [Embleya scabrispora]|uniref:protein kinase domain-containing protein n=1 Tax=Embleya scabrispora TaxID=159449 RepID=UPI00191203D8|nr:hypothetical protein [Embleya scabrispora]